MSNRLRPQARLAVKHVPHHVGALWGLQAAGALTDIGSPRFAKTRQSRSCVTQQLNPNPVFTVTRKIYLFGPFFFHSILIITLTISIWAIRSLYCFLLSIGLLPTLPTFSEWQDKAARPDLDSRAPWSLKCKIRQQLQECAETYRCHERLREYDKEDGGGLR